MSLVAHSVSSVLATEKKIGQQSQSLQKVDWVYEWVNVSTKQKDFDVSESIFFFPLTVSDGFGVDNNHSVHKY